MRIPPLSRCARSRALVPSQDGARQLFGARMKEIPLTRGLVALVDDEDYDLVSARRWWAKPSDSCHETWYAYAVVPGTGRDIAMHRLILGAPPRQWIDHVNHNGLDNQRANIRFCTPALNNANARYTRTRTGFRGVYPNRAASTYYAAIRVAGRLTRLGAFRDPIVAALAYDHAARFAWGEFATLNFPEHSAQDRSQAEHPALSAGLL